MLSLPPLAPNYPYAFPPPSSTKRANTLLIKHALVDLLPVEIGELYWSLLTKLVTGRITKNEFELGWSSMRQLSESNNNIANDVEADDLFERLEILHNSFLLSILYNTTKTTLPPASVSHQGWTSKRKRGEAGLLAEGGSDPLGILNKKRRKLKKLTAGMTKSEKKRLKALLGVNASSNEKEKALVPNSKPGQGLQQQQQRPGLLMPPSAGLKTPSSAAFQQEYQRVSALPSMYDSKEIYDVNSMRDRMAGIAYTNGVNGGLDTNVAGMVSVALDIYLRDILTSLLGIASPDVAGEEPITAAKATSSTRAKQPKGLITRQHMSALIDLRPSLFHSSHLGSIERFISLEGCEYADSREERIRVLEVAQKEREEARLERQKLKMSQKSSSSSRNTTSSNSENKKAVSPIRRDYATSKGEHGSSSLQAELFPELPKSDNEKEQEKEKEQEQEQEKKAKRPPVIAIPPSSEDEREEQPVQVQASHSVKDLIVQQLSMSGSAPNTKDDRGRLGLWKLLTGILEVR